MALILKLLEEAKKDPVNYKADYSCDEYIVGDIKCENPSCITTIEQELDHVFKIVDKESGVCRCVYCEAKEFINK